MVSSRELAVAGRLADFCGIRAGRLNALDLVRDISQLDWDSKGGEMGAGELGNTKVEDRFMRGRMLISDVLCVEESTSGTAESGRARTRGLSSIRWRLNGWWNRQGKSTPE